MENLKCILHINILRFKTGFLKPDPGGPLKSLVPILIKTPLNKLINVFTVRKLQLGEFDQDLN